MRVTGFDGQQQAARKALGPTARAVHPSPPHPVKFKPPPLSTLGGSPNVHAPTPGHTYKPIKQGPMPVLGFSNKQLDRIGMSRRARARQSAQQQGRPMVGPPNTQTAVSKLEQIRRGLNKQSDQYAAMFDPVSHENLAFDANFAKNLIPQSLVDIAHGRAPSGKHLGTDALFFLPWSRGLRASAEAINAARIADEAGRGVKAAEAAKASFKEGRGVIGGLTGAGKKLLPSERALRASAARTQLFQHLDSTLEPKMAMAQKRLFDKSVKAMVRNGNAKDTAEAAGKLIRVGTPQEEKIALHEHMLTQAEAGRPATPAEIRSRLFKHFERNLGPEQAATHKRIYDAAVANAAPGDVGKIAAIHAHLAEEAKAGGLTHPGDALHQDFTEPPRSAGEVAIRAQEAAGSPIRGAFEPITTPDGIKSIIHLTEHANVTTLPHELGHFLRRFGLNPQHEAAISEWAGVKNGVWDRPAEEKFAQGLESFIRSGDAPNSLRAEFNVLAPAFRAEYPTQGLLPTLTPEVAQVYKQLLGQKDGLHNAAAFLLRNRIAAHQLAIAGRRGPNRTDEGAQMYLDQLAKETSAAGFGTRGGGPVAHLARGETTPETGGALGALVRAGLEDPSGLKAVGTYERVGAALDNAPKSIAQMEAQQEAARGVARSVKAGNLHAAQQDALNTENPFQSFLAAGAARKGMLPKAEFHGFATLEPHLNDLTMFVGNHPGLRPFEKSNVMEAIARGITDQKMPTAYERKLLRKAFGREAATGWAKAVRKGEITLADVLNVPRAAMASADLSAGLRQGLAAAFYKPGMFTQDWIKQLGFAFSEGRYQEAQKMIEDHPWFSLADRAKVSYTEIGSDLNAREEAFGSQLAEQIPGVGKIIRGSDRAYTGFLNVLRMHLFNYMVHDAATKGWNMDDHALESIGSVVNAMTGRGNLPQALAEHRAFLNAMFFSPGLAFSRLNMLGFGGGHGWQNLIPGSWYMALHPYARQEALRSFTRLAAGISTVLFFAHAAGASVSIDPRNSDFGKIRIGDTRFDVAGGFQQWVRLVTELGTGQIVSSTTGRTESLSGGGGLARTRLDAALQFLENKAAPVPAMTLDLLRGTGFGNQPLSVQGELAGHLVPLVWQDMYQIGFTGPPWNAHLNKEPGAGIGMAAAAAIPDLLGVGVQNYGAPGPKTGLDRSNLDTQSQKFLGHKPPPQVEADVQWKAQLDANTYAGQSSFDKAKAVTQLFDQRYHTNLSASLLPKLHTQGQAEAVYRELRSKLFPALEQWQTAVDRAKRAAGEKAPVPQNTPPPGATSAPASVVTDAQDASYHIPASQVDHGVLAAHHTIIHPGTGQDHSGAIAQAAQAHGLDPQAVLAVASQEGLSGGVGDHGTSFGPFQLHAGGALPAEVWAKGAAYAQQWAWSPQGINYALSRMSAARGLHGQAAVSAIVSQFERPANPGAEIQGAMGAYGHAGAAGAIQMPGGFGGGPGPGLGAGPSRLTSAADQALEMLASGTYSPMRMLSVLSSQPLQNTMAMPGGIGHIRFQIPKFTGPVGKAARGAIALAQAFLGTPYVWGGESPKGFDCSGLLQYIYAKQGIHIPRTSEQQFNAGTPVGKSQLRPGDAVFFRGAAGEASPGHVGIYIGHGKFIEAPHTGATVRISNLAGYPGYVGARRYARARGRRAA